MTNAPYLVLVVGGTGESFPGDSRTAVTGMLANITNNLDPERFESRWVPYDAAYGPVTNPVGVAYAESVEKGLSALLARLEDDPRPVVLMGYSQGAAVVSTLLDFLANPNIVGQLKNRIIGAVLLANPNRPQGSDTLGPIPDTSGYGITYDPAYPTPARVVPTIEVAHPQDAICSADPDSMLRSIARVTEFMSFTNLDKWGRDVLADAQAIDWMSKVTSFSDVAYQANRFHRAIGEALGYLTGRHTAYNVESPKGTSITYTTLSAQWVLAATNAFERRTQAAA